MMQWRLSESTRAYVEETMRETAALSARVTALEAAARATCDVIQRFGWCEVCSKATRPRPGYQGEPHRADCPVGRLERLLEGQG